MTLKEFQKLTEIIYRRVGIFIELKKFEILNRKIDKYMVDNGYKDFRSFFHDIRFDKDKRVFQDLINIVTVNETYFFRENYQFESLIQCVLPQLHKIRDTNEPIRILCSPSSTGEEPYSVALHLLNEGRLIEEKDYEIVGIDIDSKAIEKAKKGEFSKRSIQFLPPHLLRRYFSQKGNAYLISDFLKDVIDFRTINVMDKVEMKKLGKFDIIFSRNMLIYFNDESRKVVAMTFYEMLKSNGYVFLGHAESMSRIVSVFRTSKLKDSIAYKKV